MQRHIIWKIISWEQKWHEYKCGQVFFSVFSPSFLKGHPTNSGLKHTHRMLRNVCRRDGEDVRQLSVRGKAHHQHTQHNIAVLLPLQLHIDGPNGTIKQSIWDNDICGQSISARPLSYNVIGSTFTQVWHGFLKENPTRGTKPNQQQAVWTQGRNPGWTHVHKPNTGCRMEETRLSSGRPGQTCGSDYTTCEQLDASAPLFAFVHHFVCQLGYFLSIFFYPLSLSPLSACISRSTKASERAPRSLQLEMWRVPIYIPLSYPYPSDLGPPTWNTGCNTWFHVQKLCSALLKISAKAT